MDSITRNLALLDRHLDLLPCEKQSVARWLTEEWRGGDSKLPRQLRSRISRCFSYDLARQDAPLWLLRELALELLALSKSSIARRLRVGASRRQPVGPRSSSVE